MNDCHIRRFERALRLYGGGAYSEFLLQKMRHVGVIRYYSVASFTMDPHKKGLMMGAIIVDFLTFEVSLLAK